MHEIRELSRKHYSPHAIIFVLMSTPAEIARQFNIPIGSIPKLLEAISARGKLTQSAVKEHAGREMGKTIVPQLGNALRKLTAAEVTELHAGQPLATQANDKRLPITITSIDELREAIKSEQIKEGDSVEVTSLVTPKGKFGYPVWTVTRPSKGTVGIARIPDNPSDTLMLRIDRIDPRPSGLDTPNMPVKTHSGNISLRIIPKQD